MKIFGIGLNKTGTKTLREAMQILGYNCKSCDRDLLKKVVSNNSFKYTANLKTPSLPNAILESLNQYDFFEDWPWPFLYENLYNYSPKSKFILTTRKTSEIWYESLKKHSLRTHPTQHCRKLAYGYNYPHKKKIDHLRFYLNHTFQVKKYFKNKPENLLEVCWENGDGWEKLCSFIGERIPDVPFPHMNKGSEVKVKKSWYVANKIMSSIGI